ncbi:hypothetical protein ACX0G9_26955 [Flavitalea flava]
MKYLFVLLLPSLCLSSCLKNNGPRVETIVFGSKWGLRIGASTADIYRQVQALGKEKGFYDLGLANQKPFSSPENVKDRLAFYYALTLIKNTGELERVVIRYIGDTINSVEVGGALPDETTKWPLDVPDEIALKKGDPVSGIYSKLHALYQLPAYNNTYQIQLSDKPLNKAIDPGMIDNGEWLFYFFENVRPGVSGRSTVRLTFKNGKLTTIYNEYSEYDVVN